MTLERQADESMRDWMLRLADEAGRLARTTPCQPCMDRPCNRTDQGGPYENQAPCTCPCHLGTQ